MPCTLSAYFRRANDTFQQFSGYQAAKNSNSMTFSRQGKALCRVGQITEKTIFGHGEGVQR
ncbi:MAG: hypothetical protein D3903_17760 [Candidatus Electrothrix sp. GM3_4]|nr:hypothetical protein [Candidatus Electrothrix sp. GM3_4]